MSAGCGCGGSSAVAVKGNCSCGCDVLTTGAGFVRPRFFGGMLLTEDDLQAAIDYTVAKRRLTNRNVIGAGVVCGLEVACNPCDAGKVVVSPGYAIECCGNDILVSCEEDVDILALARDLRQRTGVDCGDASADNPRRDYHLYVRYAEQPTEPVAPYAPDDCATGECEYSRVREGYCFELRCDPADPVRTILDALAKCRPDDARAADDKTMATVLRLAAGGEVRADERPPAPPPGEVTPPSLDEFDAFSVDSPFDDGLALLVRATRSLALDDPPGATLAPTYRDELVKRSIELAERLRSSPDLGARPADETARITRFLEQARVEPQTATLDVEDDVAPAPATDAAAAADEAASTFVAAANRIRDVILGRLTGDGQTACDEYRAVSALRFDGLTATSRQNAVKLGQSYLRLVAACSCEALHPPCPTCTDDAVALARVRVEDCKVVDVCSLERTWVLSPRAVAYWLPVVEMLRQSMEAACCGDVPLGRHEHEPPDAIGDRLSEAWTVFGEATTAPPEIRSQLLVALGRADAPSTPTPAVAAPRLRTVRELEVRIDELTERLDKLSAGKVT